jgi:hypothetical protein
MSIKQDYGAAYIFHGYKIENIKYDSNQANITFTGQEDGGNFGFSLSYAGDLNNDLYDDIIVGAPGEDRSYIYYGDKQMNTWIQSTKVDFELSSKKQHVNFTKGIDGEAQLETFYDYKAITAYSNFDLTSQAINRTWNQRNWNEETKIDDYGAELSNWFVIKSGSIRKNEKILAVSDEGLDINVQVLTGENWDYKFQLSDVISDERYRCFDIAYESISGDAILVYYNKSNPGSPNMILRYRVWNGTSWSEENSTEPVGNADVHWLTLASNPLSDEILMITFDTNRDIFAQVWNGSKWGFPKLIETDASRDDSRCFDVIYESQSGHGMLVWGGDSSSNKNMRYRKWVGNWSWPADKLSSADNQVNIVELTADPKTNHIICGNLDNGKDIDIQIWDGRVWSTPEIEVTADAERNLERCFDIAWESKGYAEGLIVYGVNDETPRYRTINGTIVNNNEYIIKNPNIDGDKPNWIELESDPQSDDIMLLWLEDDGGGTIDDITAELWNGAEWINANNIAINSDRDKGKHFDLAYTDTSGNIISAAYDAKINFCWGKISWNADIPSETNLSFRTRTSADGSSWSSWSKWYDNYDRISSPANRWIQYQVKFETTNISRTPTLFDVSIVLNHPDVIINGTFGENFGLAVSNCGDVNADGFDDIIIGAPQNNSNRGSAYVFYGNNVIKKRYINAWAEANITLVGGNPGDNFGYSVGSAGYFNDDLYYDIIVSAPNANATGMCYNFYGGSSLGLLITANNADCIIPGENPGDAFGWDVSTAGNFDEYWYEDIIIGAPYHTGPVGGGKVYLQTIDTSIDISWIKTYDESDIENTVFIIGNNIIIRSNITHSISSSDIIQAYITIIGPMGSTLVDNELMAIEKTDTSIPSLWKLFNYTHVEPLVKGTYVVNITAVGTNNVTGFRTSSYLLEFGPPSNIMIYSNPNSIIANGSSTSNITILVYDEFGNPIPDLSSSINLNLDLGSGSFGTISDCGNGTYYITFTSPTFSEPDVNINVSISGIFDITVIELLPGPLHHIDITPRTIELKAGESRIFEAAGLDEFDNIVELTDTSWSTNVGSFTSTTNTNASFKARSIPGNGYVNATSGLITGSAEVNITQNDLYRIEVVPNKIDLVVDTCQTFRAVGYDQHNNIIELTNTIWSTDAGTIIESNGSAAKLKAKSQPWTGYITAVSGLFVYRAEVNVIPDILDHITVTPDVVNVTAGKTQVFNAVGYDRFENEIPINPIWTTSAGVMEGTTLSAKTQAGSCYVNATVGSVVGSAVVNILPDVLSIIIVTPNQLEIIAGADQLFSAAGYDIYNNIIEITPAWTTDIGVILNSTLFAQTIIGTGYVEASVDGIKGNATVKVIPGPLHAILVIPDSIIVIAGGSCEFEAHGLDQYNNTIDISPIWYSSVGTMDGNVLTAKTRVEKGTVSASYQNKIGNANVTIVPAELDSIFVNPPYKEVIAGKSCEFSAIGYDIHNNELQVNPVWSTDVGVMDGNIFTAQKMPGEGFVYAELTLNSSNKVITGSAIIHVILGDLPERPRIIGKIPNQEKFEDCQPWYLTLTPYESDDKDFGTNLVWYVTGENNLLYILSGEYSKDDTLKFTPIPNAYGFNKITLWLVDSEGYLDHKSIWVNLTPVNDAPLFSNAPDLIIHYESPYSFNYQPYVSDIDNVISDLTISSTEYVASSSSKSRGSKHIQVDGLNVTYNYPKSMLGSEIYVTLIVSDGEGISKDIIKITVTDDWVPNIAKRLPDLTIYEGTVVRNAFDLDDYFFDPDGDALYYTYGETHINVTINADHSVDVSSFSDWFGIDTVTFRAEDPIGALAEDSIKVTVLSVNDPPRILHLPDLIVHYDYDYEFDLTYYINDIDNDSNELKLINSDPSHIQFDDTNNMLMIINFPESFDGMTVPVTITVTDGLDSDTQNLNIKVTNNYPPKLTTSIPDIEFEEDSELLQIFDLDDYFFDLDGDSLYYTYGQINVEITIDYNNKVNFGAKPDWYGLETIIFRAEDSIGAIAEDSIVVRVLPINDAPTILDIPSQKGKTGEMWILDLRHYLGDVDNNLSELMISVDSDLAVVSGLKLVFYSEEPFSSKITVTVSDGNKNATRTLQVEFTSGENVISISDLINWIAVILVILIIVGALVVFKKYMGNYRIEEAFLIYENGILLARKSSTKETEGAMDGDILSSMITAVQDFIEDGFAQKLKRRFPFVKKNYSEKKPLEEWKLQQLQMEGHNVMIERGNFVYLVIIFSGDTNWKLNRLVKSVLKETENNYNYSLTNWKGNMDNLQGISECLNPFFKDNEQKK